MCLKSLTRVSVIYGCITNDPKIKWFRATKLLISQPLWVRNPKVVSLLVLAQGLLRGCSPDVGLGFCGTEDRICETAPCDMTVGKRGTAMGLGYGEKAF